MTLPEQPIGERLATGLRALADLAEQHPQLGRELVHPVYRLTVVLPGGIGLAIDDFAEPLAAVGAAEIAADIADREFWEARAWALPGGVVHLTITALALS